MKKAKRHVFQDSDQPAAYETKRKSKVIKTRKILEDELNLMRRSLSH